MTDFDRRPMERFRAQCGAGQIAPRLPALRHRAVLGEAVADDEVDLARHFEETPCEESHPMALDDSCEDADRVFPLLFTSGTSGEPKGVLHTSNTLYVRLGREKRRSAGRRGGTGSAFRR
ncbi:hypothetical protein ACQP1W_22560 [Spirillospora sp. CA-255316]